MEGQATAQPMNVNSAAAAIESLLNDSGDFVAEAERPVEQPAGAEDSGDEPEEASTKDAEPREDEAEAEPEQVSLETIDDVAQALGVDPEDLLANLKMRVKVNGEEKLVALKEAQTGHQLEADYRRKTSALAEQRRALEQEYVQQQALHQQRVAETAAALQLAEQALIADMQSPVMQEMRQRAPAEWSARQMEAQQKLAAFQQARQYAVSQWNQQQQSTIAQQQQQLQSFLAQEQEVLSSALAARGSSWDDDAKGRLASFLKNEYGFSDKEVGSVYNHRLILLALDAMRGKESAAKAAVVKQKVQSMPPIQRPGKQTSAVQVNRDRIANLKRAATRSGKIKDAASVIEALL